VAGFIIRGFEDLELIPVQFVNHDPTRTGCLCSDCGSKCLTGRLMSAVT
jgi:hypothetical protein